MKKWFKSFFCVILSVLMVFSGGIQNAFAEFTGGDLPNSGSFTGTGDVEADIGLRCLKLSIEQRSDLFDDTGVNQDLELVLNTLSQPIATFLIAVDKDGNLYTGDVVELAMEVGYDAEAKTIGHAYKYVDKCLDYSQIDILTGSRERTENLISSIHNNMLLTSSNECKLNGGALALDLRSSFGDGSLDELKQYPLYNKTGRQNIYNMIEEVFSGYFSYKGMNNSMWSEAGEFCPVLVVQPCVSVYQPGCSDYSMSAVYTYQTYLRVATSGHGSLFGDSYEGSSIDARKYTGDFATVGDYGSSFHRMQVESSAFIWSNSNIKAEEATMSSVRPSWWNAFNEMKSISEGQNDGSIRFGLATGDKTYDYNIIGRDLSSLDDMYGIAFGWDAFGLEYGTKIGGSVKAGINASIAYRQKADGKYTRSKVEHNAVYTKDDSTDIKNVNVENGADYRSGIEGSIHNSPAGYDGDWVTEGYKPLYAGEYLVKHSIDKTNDIPSTLNFTPADLGVVQSSVNVGTLNAGYTDKPYTGDIGNTPRAFASKVSNSMFGTAKLSNNDNDMSLIGLDVPTYSSSKLMYNLTAKAVNRSKISKFELDGGTVSAKTSDDGEDLGIAVAVYVKPASIRSYITYARLEYDDNLNPTLTQTDNSYKDYTSDTYTTFDTKYKRTYVAIVPNSSGNTSYHLPNDEKGNNIWSKVKDSALSKGKDLYNFSDFKTTFTQNLSGGKYYERTNATTIGLGEDGCKGFSVYVLEIVVPENIVVESEVALQDYQLNYIHNDILASTGKKLTNSGEALINGTNGTDNCLLGGSNHVKYLQTQSNSAYAISSNAVAGTQSQQGVTLSKDKSLPLNNKLIYYNTAYGINSGYTRDQLDGGIPSVPTNEQKVYTYAFNLARGNYDDGRTVSALSKDSVTDIDLDTLVSAYGNKYGILPDDTNGNPIAPELRNSYSLVTDGIKDTFVWNSSWVGKGRAPLGIDKLIHTKVIGGKLVTCSYDTQRDSDVRPLRYRGFSLYQVTDKLTEKIYKYSTDTLAKGENNNEGTLNLHSNTVTSGLGNTTSTLAGNEYRWAVISKLNGTDIKFYPEVRMRAYYNTANDKILSGSLYANTVLTMGELERKVNPSSMYLIKVNDNSGNSVEGTVYSDTMGVGTNAGQLGNTNNKPVIYGGSDITLNVKGNYDINLYGYALDLIDRDKDGSGMQYTSSNLLPYSSVVNDTAYNPYSEWGNPTGSGSTVHDQLLNQYTDWVSAIKDSLYADVTLRVNGAGVKTFNNFNVSLGELGGNNSYEEGVYPLYVRRGELDKTSVTYLALIDQIASDYGCSVDEAGEIFEASDIYQTIIRAVEDTKDSYNNSQSLAEDNVDLVRNRDLDEEHWYDEEVKTFVVRRYYTDAITTKNIILTDKLDYGLTPDSTAGTGGSNAQQGSYKGYDAEWYLSLYFNTNNNTYISESSVYNPDSGLIDESASYNTGGNVLINNVYIQGADFQIPSATTSDIVR